MKVCEYCGGTKFKDNCCLGCRSDSTVELELTEIVKGDPFFYNGYIVWTLTDWGYETCTWYFYLGNELVETIKLSRDVYRRFVPENTDGMGFIWDLFTVAQGEEEVLRVMEQNSKPLAQFEIRRVKTRREEWLDSMTYQDVVAAIMEGEREFREV